MNTKIQGKLAGFPRWINGLFKSSLPENDKQTMRKNPGHCFRGLYENIEWNSPHYLNVTAMRFNLIAKGFKHHPNFFDVMVVNGECFYIDQYGQSKKIGVRT